MGGICCPRPIQPFFQRKVGTCQVVPAVGRFDTFMTRDIYHPTSLPPFSTTQTPTNTLLKPLLKLFWNQQKNCNIMSGDVGALRKCSECALSKSECIQTSECIQSVLK